jgi:hypothetical protein
VPRPTSLGARGWRYQLRGRTDRKVCPKASRKRLGASRRSTGPTRWGLRESPGRHRAAGTGSLALFEICI